jgi:drug/metabolite transporter (DMT)-like permease
MGEASRRLLWKTWLFAFITVMANAVGNLLLTFGIRASHWEWGPEFRFSLWLVAGVALLIVWMLAKMALLSWADLSYVLPVTAFGYVLSAALGRLFLNESITAQRWAGIALITAGMLVVGSGKPDQKEAG